MSETYSLSGDFPNGNINQPNFIKEIEDSSITTTLIGVGINGDVVTITFQSALSGPESTTLDGLVAAHAGDLSAGRLDIYYDQSPDVIIPTGGWTNIPFTDNRIVDSGYTHIAGATGTTINVAGTYMITSRVGTQCTSGSAGSARTISESRIILNGSPVSGSLGAMYNRQVDLGHNSTAVQVILNLSAGDVIGVQAQAFIGSGEIRLLSEGCSLTIMPI